MKTTLLTLLLGVSLVLAGCTGGDDPAPGTPTGSTPTGSTPTTTTPASTTPVNATPTTPTTPAANDTGNATEGLTNASYALTAVGIPAQVEVGRAFNFTLFANGTLNRTTEHVGAHYADNVTTTPPGPGRRDCAHATGSVPGVWLVNCTISQPGTWHVFGHLRLVENGTTYDYWAAPQAVKVRNYTLTLAGFPTTPQVSNQSFTFTLNLTGTENVTSDHVGAHVFNASTPNPTVSAQVAPAVGVCTHGSGFTAGNHTVSCTIVHNGAAPGTYYVRGHLRITEGGVQTNFWSAEHTVTVLGSVI